MTQKNTPPQKPVTSSSPPAHASPPAASSKPADSLNHKPPPHPTPPNPSKEPPRKDHVWQQEILGVSLSVSRSEEQKQKKTSSKEDHRLSSLKNLPNSLTLLRLALIPLFIVLAPWDYRALNQLAALVFAVAAITDFLDGYFARKLNLTSSFGAILDLLADKALLAAAAVVLSARYPYYVPLFSLLVIREVVVMGLRNLSLEKGYTIAAGGTGKAKTVFLSLAMVALVLGPSAEFPWMSLGFICLLLGCFLSVRSAWLYTREFWHHFSSLEPEPPKKENSSS